MEQFTYTGSPWGYSAPGWTVFQRSAGMNPKAAEALRPLFAYAWPQSKDGFAPVQFTYAGSAPNGGCVVAQTVDAGPRWYDPNRGHDYFAHVVSGDAGAADASFNPLALVGSPSLQTAFPENLKERALKILNGEIPDEPTPKLDQIADLSALEPSPSLSFDAAVSRLPAGAFPKLGLALAALMERRQFQFDAASSDALDFLAAALALLPPSFRRSLCFSTWIPQSAAETHPLAGRLAFFGTRRAGVAADPDTGLYEIPASRAAAPRIASADDARLLKRLVDSCGAGLSAADFAPLLAAFDIASDRAVTEPDAIAAADLAGRFPGLKREFEATGLAAALDTLLAGRRYRDALAAVRGAGDLDRFFQIVGGKQPKGVDMAKDLVDRMDFRKMASGEVLKAMRKFRTEGLSEERVLDKALEAAQINATVKARQEISELKDKLAAAEARGGGGFWRKIAAFSLALLLGAIIGLAASRLMPRSPTPEEPGGSPSSATENPATETSPASTNDAQLAEIEAIETAPAAESPAPDSPALDSPPRRPDVAAKAGDRDLSRDSSKTKGGEE